MTAPDPGTLSAGERDAVHADLGELLEMLGLGNYARPESPHAVFRQCLAEVLARLEAMEHLKAALAGDNEGVRLWMLDCGSLVQKHRERAERAEAKLAAIRQPVGNFLAEYGTSEIPVFKVGQDLANSILRILDAEAERDGNA